MVSVGSMIRVRDQLLFTISRSSSVAASLIVISTLATILFGAVLTPSTNVSAAPFVIPTLIAAFQNARWVWVTSSLMIPIYGTVAFGVESVPLSSGLVNLAGLILFGFVFTWVAVQRQRVDEHAAALEQMEANLRFAMQNSDVRLFSHDCDLRYTWVPNYAPAFPREQMLGQTDEALFPPHEAQELMALKRRAVEEERQINAEITIMRGNQPRVFQLTTVPTWTELDGQRVKTGITCVSVDVTDLRQAVSDRDDLVRRQEKALHEAATARKNLERLTSMIAHDLVQPLTVIQGHSDMLRRRLGTESVEQQVRTLDALNRSVERMLRLIDDLRDVAALQQGRFSLTLQPTDVVSVIEYVVQDYQTTTEVHSIRFHAPERLWGHVDDARLGQLISNLLSNAIKYSPEGGDIDVHVGVEGNFCLIEVTDHGVGMALDSMDHLFDMFTRLDNVQSTQGLGLGLFISKGIIEAHGGSIRVESQPGSGSTFRVTLPLSPRIVIERSPGTVAERNVRGVA